MVRKYKGLIFDLNGVLILDKPGYKTTPLEDRVFKRMGLSLEDVKEKERIKKELNWSEEDFWKFVNSSWNGAMPNLDLINLIKKLRKKGYKTAILSNTSGLIMRQRIRDYFGENINNLFDNIVISSEVGFLKPDKKIYELVLRKLETEASKVIFIDDAEEYLNGASQVGITPILFTNNQNLESELAKLCLI